MNSGNRASSDIKSTPNKLLFFLLFQLALPLKINNNFKNIIYSNMAALVSPINIQNYLCLKFLTKNNIKLN